MISCICSFKEIFFTILHWCERHDAVLIAIAGFLSSVAIAKIRSGLDVKRMLCMRRFDAYENAITHLSLKLNVYYNIRATFESLKEPELAVEVIKSKVAILVAYFEKLGELEKEDSKITSVTLYTEFSPYDSRPLVKELAYFLSRLLEFSSWVNLPCSEERLKQLESSFRGDVERIVPMVENEINHLDSVCTQLKYEIAQDKMMKKLFRKKRLLRQNQT